MRPVVTTSAGPLEDESEDDGPDGERPSDEPVAGGAESVVDPEQEWSDGDGDAGEGEVGVSRCDDDGREHEGSDEFDDGRDGDGAFEACGVAAGGAWCESGGRADPVGERNERRGAEYHREGGSEPTTEGDAPASEPEGGEAPLDDPSDAQHPPRPRVARGFSCCGGARGASV